MNGVEGIVKYTLAGIFMIGLVSFVAKDGQQIGSFLTSTGNAFGNFAKSVQAT